MYYSLNTLRTTEIREKTYKKNNTGITHVYKFPLSRLSNQLNDTTSSLDLLLSQLRNQSSLNDDWDVRNSTLTQDLTVTGSQGVDNRSSSRVRRLQVLVSLLLWDQSPELVEVEDRSPELVLLLVEVPHTDLTEVTRVVLIHVDSVVVLTTGLTSTTRVLSVLTDTTSTGCLK